MEEVGIEIQTACSCASEVTFRRMAGSNAVIIHVIVKLDGFPKYG